MRELKLSEMNTRQKKILENKFKIIDESIRIIKELENLKNELLLKQSSLENDKKIIASIENEEYKKLSVED